MLSKVSNKECFHFFLFFPSWGRPFFFVFLFLAVSSRIRFQGRGEWVCEKAAEEEVTDWGWQTAQSGTVKGRGSRCRDVVSRPISSCWPASLKSLFPPQRPEVWHSNPGWWCWPCHLGAPRCAGCSGEERCRQSEHLCGKRERSRLCSH